MLQYERAIRRSILYALGIPQGSIICPVLFLINMNVQNYIIEAICNILLDDLTKRFSKNCYGLMLNTQI